ncbi:glycine cleavage system protein H [Thermodesulfobacterium commune]|jgi:glycine cleavage system H protein|uniref:glycine cleavage system protein H n=1 Tax=Thermodesulfobacterium commune TaxID=1741 RepID=UPI000EE12289|nr:glycine cleavage system protein [Thermodesulfobacterium sp.]HCE80098.1 glycine cleavage system protein H [Thermodesulfobacterium commune]
MFKVPEDRLYTEGHLWVKKKKKKIVRVGITEYFILKSMEIIDIDLPEEEEEFEKDEIFGSIETIEQVFDLLMPVSGKIVKVNEKVLEDIEILNEDPFDEGWLIEIEMTNPAELEELLPPEDYELRLEDLEDVGPEKFLEEEEE